MPSSVEIRHQLENISRDGGFTGSPRMLRFLSFTVEEALEGRGTQLKEIVIGCRVFDRNPAYDSRLDPIVRVEARRLRLKLAEYYAGPGKDDPLVIEYPKGQYAPVFRVRSAPAISPGPVTIAVLPFANLSAEGKPEYLSDGLTEELIHALTRIRGVRIVAWDSAAQFRDQQDNTQMLRRQLGAEYALRGSVRVAGSRLRVAAYLIQTEDGQYLWSETFDRKMADILEIEQEIAIAIADALDLRLQHKTSPDRPALAVRNMEAYQLYLMGRFHARDRTLEGLKRSLILFQNAVEMDSSSALFHSGIADTYALLAEYGMAEDSGFLARAKEAAEQAISLDPECAEAHASHGLATALYDWNWKQAATDFRRAIELNSNYVPAHFWYGSDCLAMLGRFPEAEAELDMALKLDPLSLVLLLSRGFIRYLARDNDAALRDYRRTAEADPSFFRAYTSIGRAAITMGDYDAAIQALNKGHSIAGNVPNIISALGQAYAMAGERDRARQLLATLHEMGETRQIPSTCFAMVHIGLGEHDYALDWLERGAARHQASIVVINVHPVYDPLRSDPRFQAMLEKLGFAA